MEGWDERFSSCRRHPDEYQTPFTYITMHMMIKDISLFPRSSPSGQKRYNQGRYIKDSNILLLVIMIMVMMVRTEGRRDKIEGDTSKIQTCCWWYDNYDVGDDGDEGGIEGCDSNKWWKRAKFIFLTVGNIWFMCLLHLGVIRPPQNGKARLIIEDCP